MASSAPASGPAAKKLTLSHRGTTFTLKLFPGTSDSALRSAVAGRLRLPVQLSDGSESFYLSDRADGDSIVPLCADGLPDGQTLTGAHDLARGPRTHAAQRLLSSCVSRCLPRTSSSSSSHSITLPHVLMRSPCARTATACVRRMASRPQLAPTIPAAGGGGARARTAAARIAAAVHDVGDCWLCLRH